MKSYLCRLLLFTTVLSVLTLNVTLADSLVTQEFSTGNIAVSFADLNLANPKGLDRLYWRVKSAAYKVCGVENMKVSLDVTRNNRECVSSAIDNAIGEIGDVRLTALHQSKLFESSQS
jgi:UrcA family protein